MRLFLICLLLFGGVFFSNSGVYPSLSAAVYVKSASNQVVPRQKAKRWAQYQKLKWRSRRMMKWALYSALAWLLVYLYVRSRADDTASLPLAILLFGLMGLFGLILLYLLAIWLWWLISGLWAMLFPARKRHSVHRCYKW